MIKLEKKEKKISLYVEKRYIVSRLIKYIKEAEIYKIPMIKKEKEKKLNLKTNREKTFRKTMYHETDIIPKDRTFENLPIYADKKPKVKFQDWLLIKPEKTNPDHDVCSFGKSEADGKFYGWSHRAVCGFGIGDKVKPGTCGLNNINKKAPFTIKNDKEARDMAIAFAKDVS